MTKRYNPREADLPLSEHGLGNRGRYEHMKPDRNDIIRSDVLPGFQFRVSDLCRQPKMMEMGGNEAYPYIMKIHYEVLKKRSMDAMEAIQEAEASEKTAREERKRAKEAKKRAAAEKRRADKAERLLAAEKRRADKAERLLAAERRKTEKVAEKLAVAEGRGVENAEKRVAAEKRKAKQQIKEVNVKLKVSGISIQ